MGAGTNCGRHFGITVMFVLA